MLFNSLDFLVFIAITVCGYPLAGRLYGRTGGIVWLIAASLLFYGWWNPRYVALLLASILINFAIGSRLRRQPSLSLCIGGVAFNLALLGYYKYTNFFLELVQAEIEASIVLPLAISFFTFQQVAFLVDSYRGRADAVGLGRYALFVMFFPQLIAGPIVRHDELLPQLARLRIGRLNGFDLAVGTTIFVIGLFKKVVIADSVAAYANPVFDAADMGLSVTFVEAWGGAFAYTFQIYFDFSGYSDMAIGLARLFGLRLPANFNAPYKATSIRDFWQRWHMTLSRFLRDYLYIPLGGNRHGSFGRYRNMMIVMLLGGLWHGAGWTFVLWGALHGFYLCVHGGWRALADRFGGGARLPAWLGRCVTLFAVVVAWVVFRARSLDGAREILTAMVPSVPLGLSDKFEAPLRALGWGEPYLRFEATPLFFGSGQLFWLVALLILVWTADTTQQAMARFRPVFQRVPKLGPLFWSPRPGYAVLVGLLAGIGIVRLVTTVETEFLYFQF